MGNLIDLFKQGHTTLYREEEPYARFTFHVIDKKKGTHGPWVTIEDPSTDAGVLEPPKILITELPYEGWFTSLTKATEPSNLTDERANTKLNES